MKQSGRRPAGFKAWLVRWEWIGDHARVDEPVIAILSPNLGVDNVKTFVERFYAATTYTPGEKLQFMRDPKSNPYRATLGTVKVTMEDGTISQIPWAGEVICGHNPFIHASLVTDLKEIELDDPAGAVVWTAQPRPIMDLRRRDDTDSWIAND